MHLETLTLNPLNDLVGDHGLAVVRSDPVASVLSDVAGKVLGVRVEHLDTAWDIRSVRASPAVAGAEDKVFGTVDDLHWASEIGLTANLADGEERAEGDGLLSVSGKLERLFGVVRRVEEVDEIAHLTASHQPRGRLVAESVRENEFGRSVGTSLEVAREVGTIGRVARQDDTVKQLRSVLGSSLGLHRAV